VADRALLLIAAIGGYTRFIQKIKRHTELAGLDVIFVHRLLKNDVPVPEYMLTSDAVHGALPDALRTASLELEADLEHEDAAA
jgi:hypothetical protein